MLPQLAIIIINYNLKDDTADCIISLLAAGAALSQISVVDNASTDGSPEFLRQRFGPDLGLIIAPDNLGYPHGLNLGIRPALEAGAEWVLFTNNDTVVAPDFFTRLEEAARQGPDFALFGPMILYYGEPERVWFLGGKRLPGTLLTTSAYFKREAPSGLPAVMPFDFIHGCCMLVKREVFQAIGLFDDSSLIYGDDVDFCWRAHLAGFRIAAAPHARMWHKISTTMKRHSLRTRYLRIRNQARFYRRYGRGLQLVLLALFTLGRGVYLALGDLLHGQPALIEPMVQGWLDGWFARPEARY